MANRVNIPASAGDVVAKGWHTERDGNSTLPNLDVVEAKRKMLEAAEPATTFKNGTRIPKHIIQQGGNTPAAQSETPEAESAMPVRQEQVPVRDESLLASANRKMRALGLQSGMRVDLNRMVSENIITAEERDAVMQSKGAPAKPAPRQQQTNPQQAEPTRQVFRDEKGRFTYSLFKERGEWVALVEYDPDNGGVQHGAERFVAPSKDALLLKLIAAKGHSSRRVNLAVQRERQGVSPDLAEVFEKLVLDENNISKDKFYALPDQAKEAMLEKVIMSQSNEFLAANLDYQKTEENGKKLMEFLSKMKWAPTKHNLQIALIRCREDGLIDAPKPRAEVVTMTAANTAGFTPTAPNVSPRQTAVPMQAPTIVARKRGTTGIMPGSSTSTQPMADAPREKRTYTDAELKSMDMKDLKAIATANRNPYRR